MGEPLKRNDERRASESELVRAMVSIGGMVTGQGTVYPLVARLRRQGLVETSWQESATGPPRRYYRLAPGRAGGSSLPTTWHRAGLDDDDPDV
jgi:PadR family transcriptional regulator PadR